MSEHLPGNRSSFDYRDGWEQGYRAHAEECIANRCPHTRPGVTVWLSGAGWVLLWGVLIYAWLR